MEKLAKDFLALSWSEMDEFAQRIKDIATDPDNDFSPNDERVIAEGIIDWANEIMDSSND